MKTEIVTSKESIFKIKYARRENLKKKPKTPPTTTNFLICL